MNIVLYGDVDKRPLVFALLKVLQDFGSVALMTPEYHYRRLIDGEDVGYFQNTLICVSDETPDTIFSYLKVNQNSYDIIIWDTHQYVPDDIDVSFICSSVQDEMLVDDMIDLFDNPVNVKLMFDGKRDKDIYNVKITLDMIKYVELAEAKKMLGPVKSSDIIKLLSSELPKCLDVSANEVKRLLKSKWEA